MRVTWRKLAVLLLQRESGLGMAVSICKQSIMCGRSYALIAKTLAA